MTQKQRKQLLQHQIVRLARIYASRPVCAGNVDWHNRVADIQMQVIKEKKAVSI